MIQPFSNFINCLQNISFDLMINICLKKLFIKYVIDSWQLNNY